MFTASTDELERLFKDGDGDRRVLQQLADELSHRTRPRAVALRLAVMRAIEGLIGNEGPAPTLLGRPSEQASEARRDKLSSEGEFAPPDTIIACSVPLRCLELSMRASNVTINAGMKYVGDLVTISPFDLARLPNVGIRTIRELEQKLSKLGLEFGSLPEGWSGEHAAALEPAAIKWLQARRGVSQIRELVPAVLSELAAVEIDPRNVKMISEQIGLDGHGGATLEAVGQRYSLTRERVRQIVARAKNRIVARSNAPEAVMRALEVAKGLYPASDAHLSAALAKEGLTAHFFGSASLANIADLFGTPTPWSVARVGSASGLMRTGDEGQALTFLRRAKRLAGKRGCANLEDITNLFPVLGGPSGGTFAIEILEQHSSFEWLDDYRGWFWFRPAVDNGRNRLINTIRRVLAVAPTVAISELRAAIRRNGRMHGFAPPTPILVRACSLLPFAKVSGGRVTRIESALDWNNVLSETDQILIDIFKERGPVLHRNDLMSCCAAQGMNPNTFTVATTYSVALWRIAQGYYSLVGAEVPPGTLEALRQQRPAATDQLIESGWLPNGGPFIAWTVSYFVLANGIFRIPPGLQPILTGKYRLKSSSGQDVGSLSVKGTICWNLASFLRRHAGEAGDVLVLLFEPVTSTCIGLVGGEELGDAAREGRLGDLLQALNEDLDQDDDEHELAEFD